MVRVFINGREVSKNDLQQYEIKSESVKRIFLEKIAVKGQKKAG